MENRNSGIELLKSTLTSGTAAAIAQVLMLIYALLAARLLKPDQYGIMAACYSVTTLTSFLFNWGLDSWLLKSASLSATPLKLAGEVLRIKLVAGLIWGLILYFLLPVMRPELYLKPILLLIVIDTLFDSFTNIFYITLIVERRIPAASGLLLLTRFLRIISVVVLFTFGINNIFLMVSLRMLMTIFTFGVGGLITKPILFNRAIISKNEFVNEVTPFALSEILTLGYYQIDINLVSFFTGDRTMVGNYSVVISLVNAVTAVYVGISNVLLPVYISAYQRKVKNFFRLIYLSVGGIALLGGIISIGFSIFSPKIIPILLGSQYYQAGIFLKAIAPLFFIKALSQIGAMLLVVVDKQKQRTIPQALAVTIKTIFQIYAFPIWQIIGIIRVYIFSELVMLMGFLSLGVRWYRKIWRPNWNINP